MENKRLKILIIGSGGREHAIGWKIKQNCTECIVKGKVFKSNKD